MNALTCDTGNRPVALTLGVTAAAGAVAGAVTLRRRSQRPPVRTGAFSNSIEYAALGTGPRTMLFLPGGPGTPTWDKALARSFLPAYATGEFTVWWLSRRRNMPAGHTIADMADDVADVIADDFGGPVDAVVGASYGGLIALHLAARHPEAVGRVVLLGSTAVIPDEAKALDWAFGEPWGNGRFTEAGEGMLAEAIPGDRLRGVRRLLAPLAGRWMKSMPYNLSDILVETQAEMDYDARSVLPQITAPVLMIAGERDMFLPREAIEETARGIADCTVTWHPRDSHVGVIRSQRSTGEVLAFLSGDSPADVTAPTSTGAKFVEIVPGVHRIPSRMVNCYLIVEPEGVTLIDAGMSKANVLKSLAGLGRKPGDLKRIIITHSDADHVGALADLKAVSGARVYASAIEAEAIAAGRPSRPLASPVAAFVLKVFSSIVKQKPAQVDELLSDGKELSIAGGLRVVATPGHTPEHISLFLPASGVLFCGDSMEAGRDGRLRRAASARTWDEEKTKESVEIQRALGAEIVCPGHGPVVRPAADGFPLPTMV